MSSLAKAGGVENRVAGVISPASVASPTTPATSKGAQLRAAAWAVMASVSGKEAVRDDLPAGMASVVNLTVTGEVDGAAIEPLAIAAVMTVGFDTERATSQTPNVGGLVAYLLGKMNAATRESVLRDLPGEFAGNDCEYPAADKAVTEASDNMLKKIRAAKRSVVRGSVSVKHTLSAAKDNGLDLFS